MIAMPAINVQRWGKFFPLHYLPQSIDTFRIFQHDNIALVVCISSEALGAV